ncbi:caspase domain-containing protein [Cubamyces lactineus]|nr:caspase domain-containing protein [Cubamyces lactineus]
MHATSFAMQDYDRPPPPAPGPPVKKALVIGINYAEKGKGGGALCGGQRDALAWRDLLINTYGYCEADIVLMIDAPENPSKLRPTKQNILQQINLLVKALSVGSRLVFYYAGHTDQLQTDSINEDDGFDECIVPAADPSHLNGYSLDHGRIIDNELRAKLVDRLPDGVSLTAIIDSCHSGTLLDLDHYHCNAVYFPWLSRGVRRLSKKKWQLVRQYLAQLLRSDSSNVEGAVLERCFARFGDSKDSRIVRITHQTQEEAARTKKERYELRVSEGNIGRRGRSSRARAAHMECNEPLKPSSEGDRTLLQRVATTIANKCPPMELPKVLRRGYSFDNHLKFPQPLKDFLFLDHVSRRTASPESAKRGKCDGWCEYVPDSTKAAHVVSIAACNDYQRAYEHPRGLSMTQTLIPLLQENPHPPCRQLVQRLGYKQHEISMDVHAASRRQWAKSQLGKRVRLPLDGVNFQDPQLGSQRRLSDQDVLIM